MIKALAKALGYVPAPRERVVSTGFRPPRMVSDQMVASMSWYDAATTTTDNAKHWQRAYELSARAANSPELRKTLRNRARFEIANNSYAKGIVDTYAHDLIGTGPRMQIRTGDRELDSLIEREWDAWVAEVDFASDLRVAAQSKMSSGEVFIQLIRVEDISAGIDVNLIEADRIAGSFNALKSVDEYDFDGIEYDDTTGRPTSYRVLKKHPGDVYAVEESTTVPAAAMVHMFRADRPGQLRGIPEITPALPLFIELRRFRLAVLGAMENGAKIAMALETQYTPEEPSVAEPLDLIEMDRNSALVLPEGYKLGGFKSEQPTINHVQVVQSYIIEAARAIGMPANIALGDSSLYNYASGRLDHQSYDHRIRCERTYIEQVFLDRVLETFIRYIDARGLVSVPSDVISAGRRIRHSWIWRGRGHVDPQKEATGSQIRLDAGLTTLAEECAREGRDWEDVLRQRALELSLMKELDIPTADRPGKPQPEEEDEPAPAKAATK